MPATLPGPGFSVPAIGLSGRAETQAEPVIARWLPADFWPVVQNPLSARSTLSQVNFAIRFHDFGSGRNPIPYFSCCSQSILLGAVWSGRVSAAGEEYSRQSQAN